MSDEQTYNELQERIKIANQQTVLLEALNKESQEKVNIAKQQVALLREDEVRLTKNKVTVEKSVARLSLELDSLKTSIDEFLLKNETLKKEIELLQKLQFEEKQTLDATIIERNLAVAQTIQAKYELEEVNKKRSEVVVHTRQVEQELKENNEKFVKDKQDFEVRKNTIRDLLSSL